MEEKNSALTLHKVGRILVFALAAVAGAIIILVLLKLLFLYSTYAFFFNEVTTVFGLDSLFARSLAVFLTVGSLMITPWIVSFLLFGKRKKELISVVAASCIAFSVGTYYATKDVYFDRATGKPVKCYAKTLEGFKFSSECDYDPKFGVKYEPISEAVMKEIYFWEKNGKLEYAPSVRPGEYFSSITGEPIVWYSKRQGGEIALFALPGYDPLTGKLLQPITAEVVNLITNNSYRLAGERDNMPKNDNSPGARYVGECHPTTVSAGISDEELAKLAREIKERKVNVSMKDRNPETVYYPK